MKRTLYALIGICALLLFSCTDEQEQVPDVTHIQIDLEVERLEKEFFQLKDEKSIIQFLDKHAEFSDVYFQRNKYPEQIVAANIQKFLSLSENDTLLMDVERVFEDFTKVEQDLKKAFQFIKYYYPDFKAPKVYTMVSGFASFGFGQDILMNKDFVVIGLDYFAGKTSSYRPPEVPGYILARYEPEYIVPTLITFISSNYNNYNYQDKSLLADMIFYGKAHFFTKKVLPYTADSLVLGYSTQQLLDIDYNEKAIWGHFVDNDLFYESSDFTKNKYVGERPKVHEISDKCPGRIGRWLGLKIVDAYMKRNPATSLGVLMNLKDAQPIFQKSKYKPAL